MTRASHGIGWVVNRSDGQAGWSPVQSELEWMKCIDDYGCMVGRHEMTSEDEDDDDDGDGRLTVSE